MAQPLSSQLNKVLFGSTTENLLFQAMLPAACCEMKRGVLRGGRRLFVELEEVVIYLVTNQHTRSFIIFTTNSLLETIIGYELCRVRAWW